MTYLSDTTLSPDKNPLQGLLIDDIFQGRLGKVSIVNFNARHDEYYSVVIDVVVSSRV